MTKPPRWPASSAGSAPRRRAAAASTACCARKRAHRNFTTLALLRLDPATGEGAAPTPATRIPLLAADGEVAEIELPGLPLGQGPRPALRRDRESAPPRRRPRLLLRRPVRGLDGNGNAYGFERPRELLRTLAGPPGRRDPGGPLRRLAALRRLGRPAGGRHHGAGVEAALAARQALERRSRRQLTK